MVSIVQAVVGLFTILLTAGGVILGVYNSVSKSITTRTNEIKAALAEMKKEFHSDIEQLTKEIREQNGRVTKLEVGHENLTKFGFHMREKDLTEQDRRFKEHVNEIQEIKIKLTNTTQTIFEKIERIQLQLAEVAPKKLGSSRRS